MKKGYLTGIIIVIAVVVVGGGIYFYKSSSKNASRGIVIAIRLREPIKVNSIK